MENSIKWDKKDLNFQGGRVAETFGQLEKEIRTAKIKMIEERIQSKEAKLAEMNETRVMLEEKIQKEKEKLERMKEQEKVRKAEEEIKAKIRADIEQKSKEFESKIGEEPAKESENEKSETKAEEPGSNSEEPVEEAKKEEKGIKDDLEAITDVLGEKMEDMVDTVKAVGKVIKDRIKEKIKSDSEEE